jgi:hypothetical protein
MSRIVIVCALAGVLTVPAKAQSLKDQLVGSWVLVSCDASNRPAPTLCANPNGIEIFDASGHYALIYAARGRPKASGRPLISSSAEEIKALVSGFAANFGTWSINEADKTITYHFDGAFFPNNEGVDFKSGTVSISEDELKIGPDVFRRIGK